MKTKKLERKLVLSKETITNLNSEEMKDLNGGEDRGSAPSTITCCWMCNTDISCNRTCPY